jgi:RNase P/RNase MRP subunit p29
MSNRSNPANVAAAATRECRPDRRAWALVLMLIAWVVVAGDLRADVIVLKNGESIEGSIVDATRNTVVVRRAIGGMRQMPIEDIEEVRIDLAQGGPITGQILSWADGVYQVRAGGEIVHVRAGRIVTREVAQEASRQTPPAQPPRPEAEPAVETAAPAAPAAEDTGAASATAETPAAEEPAAASPAAASVTAERTASEGPAAESADAQDTAAESTTAEEPAAASAAAEEPAAESHAAAALAVPKAESDPLPVAVKASVDPAAAGAAGMVFRIELSRPAEQTVVLIYGTVDGTAKAGQDYEAQQGVVTLAPGTRSAEVHVPLIEHQPPRDEARFELFLAADPKVAEIVDKRITATIQGGD